MVDRLITLNIRKYLATQPRTKRARKAVKYVRERVSHFTKIKQENVKLAYDLNNLIFKEYSRSMRPLKLRVKIGTDTADVLPFREVEPTKTVAAKDEKKPFIKIKKQETKPEEKKAAAPTAPAATPAQPPKPHHTEAPKQTTPKQKPAEKPSTA